MDTLEQLRRQIGTADDLSGIVGTMKALAAVSIRQYEAAVRSLADYARTIELGLHVVLADLPDAAQPPPPAGHAARPLGAIVFGSDHGLCGRFNEDVAVHAQARLDELAEGAPVRLLAVGARAGALLAHLGRAPDEVFFVPGSAARIAPLVRQLLMRIDHWQHEGQHEGGVERVYLFHARPSGAERHRQVGQRLLPVQLPHLRSLAAQRWPGPTLPTFRTDRRALFAALIRQHFFVSVFRACAESLAAENASRLAAMQAAQKNLSERQAELLSAFRLRRQDAITNELLDVVAGYEALQHAPANRASLQ